MQNCFTERCIKGMAKSKKYSKQLEMELASQAWPDPCV